MKLAAMSATAAAGCLLSVTGANGWQCLHRMRASQHLKYSEVAIDSSFMPRKKRRRRRSSSLMLQMYLKRDERGEADENASEIMSDKDAMESTDELHSIEIAVNGDAEAKLTNHDELATNYELQPTNVTTLKGDVNGATAGVPARDDREGRAVCRVVASSDGKLPTERSSLPPAIQKPPYILEKLDAIYHAISHDETRRLQYMERPNSDANNTGKIFDEKEERKLVSVLRNSLEDAGFELLSKRDVDLCEALNAGYLLRLAIAPDVSEFDPHIAEDFYPELFSSEGAGGTDSDDWWPFEGRVLLYRRGYSSEVTRGRLLVPKLDYLQASIVQRSAFAVTETLGHFEHRIATTLSKGARTVQRSIRTYLADVAEGQSNEKIANFLQTRLGWNRNYVEKVEGGKVNGESSPALVDPFFKLNRYGGRRSRFMGSPSIMDALSPFMTCEVDEDDSDTSFEIPRGADGLSCQYDYNMATSGDKHVLSDPSVLLERVSISNVVDLSGSEGRRNILRRFFSTAELVEPTYSEVVAIWRPLPASKVPKMRTPSFRPPKVAYDLAEIFEVEDRLPKPLEPESEPEPSPLEIRTYDDVPMANVAAVLPRTKLLFRPADAFVFDLVSVLTFVAAFSSQRFDSPRLDILAIISVSLWLIRTILRYSNKLARYDLLVKNFLTSKISHRNSGALKYITREAGTQRATRASLVYMWLAQRIFNTREPPTRKQLLRQGASRVNALLDSNVCVRVDVDAALNDLEDLQLISFGGEEEELESVNSGEESVVDVLRITWNKVFEGKMSLKSLIGRREHPST